jgi:hypothetical protein
MKEFPSNERQIQPRNYRAHKSRWPFLRLVVGETFKYCVFKMCKHLRNTESRLIFRVFSAMDGAANSAAFAILPILAFHDLVGQSVVRNLRKDLVFDGLIVVVGEHHSDSLF